MPITNHGLDQYAAYGSNGGNSIYSLLVVGTGTGTPANSDTSMYAETAESSSTGGLTTSSSSYNTDTGNDEITATVPIVRAWTNDTGSGVNLTEIGFRRLTASTLTYHDLMRDDPANPASAAVTVTVENTEQLQVYYEVVQAISFPVLASATYFVDNGAGIGVKGVEGKDTLGNIDVNKGLYADLTGTLDYQRFFDRIASAGTSTNPEVRSDIRFYYFFADFTVTRDSGLGFLSRGDATNVLTMEGYTAGTYTRTGVVDLTTSEANATWYTIVMGYFTSGNVPFGIVVDFTNPTTFVKEDTAIFSLEITWTWARA